MWAARGTQWDGGIPNKEDIMTTPNQPNPYQSTPRQPDPNQSGPGEPFAGATAQAPSAPMTPPAPRAVPPSSGGRNTVAIVALVVAVLGFVFALIKGAMIVGWILLPVAFVLAIVGLLQHGRPKGMAIAALVISVVGTIAGIVAFTMSLSDAVNDAFGQSVSASQPASTEGSGADGQSGASASPDASGGTAPSASGEGTRDNPYPIGSTITSKDWKVTVNSFTADATAKVLAANTFNQPPTTGNAYALANVTVTYTGDSSGYAAETAISFVTDKGNVVNAFDSSAVAPEALGIDELYKDASVTGNVLFEIPTGNAGLLRVQPGMLADQVFVALS